MIKNKIISTLLLSFTFCFTIGTSQLLGQGFKGYYQNPDIHQSTIVFAAEGDIWKVSTEGGLAQRLTTHLEEERYPVISPDGKTIAYSATYEGPMEVYTMSLDGGLPTRCTYSEGSGAVGWTPDGKIIYSAGEFSKLPTSQLVTLDLSTKQKSIVPLASAYHGTQNEAGTWFFTHLPEYNENIKRYEGGTAQQIWKFDGKNEAVKLTTGHLGESFNPMWHDSRLYFITDRDGIQNIWSMDADGEALKQHTKHPEFDVRSANLDNGKIVYQHAADLWLLDIASGDYDKIDIRLASDLEHLQETWVKDPSKYITSVHPSPEGDRVVVTTRGRVFVVPTASGRTIQHTAQKAAVIRHRDAVFFHDGKNILSLSDESGEFEFVQFAANGADEIKPITNDGQRLRYQGIPSPDGKWIAYDDIEKNMYVLNVSSGVSKLISTNQQGIRDFSWSPDGQWLAFVQRASNRMYQIKVYNVNDGSLFDLTTDRSNNHSVEWSPDGKFIYFLSDRGFQTLMGSPRDARQGGVYWDKSESVYHVPLKKSYRSPFREKDELMSERKEEEEEESSDDKLKVTIDKEGIMSRNIKVPVPAGNYHKLEVNEKAIYLLTEETGSKTNSHLKGVKITNEGAKLTDMASKISGFEMTQDGKKLLIRKGKSYFIVDAGTGSVNLDESIDFSGCKFSMNPREDWKQLYKDAWRMERDYFYDQNMHGVDWEAMYEKYLPLVDRVTTRNELNQVLARLVGELSVLHASARGGDMPSDDQNIGVASLGAQTSRDEANGGYRIDYIYQGDPDYFDFGDWYSPLKDPYLDIQVGDIITHVNGKDALSVMDLGELLRNQAEKQLRLTLKRGNTSKEAIVKPMGGSFWLRTMNWEYGNRLKVEKESDDQIGYLHINAMTNWDIGHFYREFFPAVNKKGLIIDVRFNGGGYVDAIILERLLRRPFMYIRDRTGEPYWRMNNSFGGHIVVLANERTGSSGEAFLIGIKQLGLGPVIGKRTWGGQVWLNRDNKLTDKGFMSAPMHGVYGPEGEWLVEGHGFVPNIEVENPPHETFNGKDAQLEAAIKLLQEKIAEDPRDVPAVPEYPDKSFKNNSKTKR